MVQEDGWAPGPVGRTAENLAPPGFDPRAVQPVASPYTGPLKDDTGLLTYSYICLPIPISVETEQNARTLHKDLRTFLTAHFSILYGKHD
jgi:hypothetical protein